MARERERMRDYVNEREERGERINLIKKKDTIMVRCHCKCQKILQFCNFTRPDVAHF